MRNADFHSPIGRLADALKQLEHTWVETKEDWSDSISQKVEEDYLVPLHGQVQALVDTVEKLAGVMAKAERACQHPRESGQVL